MYSPYINHILTMYQSYFYRIWCQAFSPWNPLPSAIRGAARVRHEEHRAPNRPGSSRSGEKAGIFETANGSLHHLTSPGWSWCSKSQDSTVSNLVGGLVAIFYFPINIGFMSSSQLTNSIIFQDGVALAHQPDVQCVLTNQHFTEAEDGKTRAESCDECCGMIAVMPGWGTSIASTHSTMRNIFISSIVENPMAEYHETVLMIFNTLSILFNCLSNRNINRW